MNKSERYSFFAIGPTSLNIEMQIVSTLSVLPKNPTVPFFFVFFADQVSRPVASKANLTFGGRCRVEPRPDFGVYIQCM